MSELLLVLGALPGPGRGDVFDDPALSIGLAVAVGMIAQAVARHLKIPGIVLLLAAGVLLGPDVADVIRPHSLGTALQTLVGFAVAVILFEGGMNLNLRRLRREGRSIRRLVTWGALVTAVGAFLACTWILGWEWRRAILFGTLVIVTGPTVITPLLRRIRLNSSVATVLEAEGVLIDAIGAILAVVTLEVVLAPSGQSLLLGGWHLLSRFGFGLAAGLAAGALIAFLLRFERAVPAGLENVFTLSLVLAVFQVCNSLVPESGIMTVTVAGLLVGNVKTRALQDLREFKEQLTVMFIGMLFVLLAADVRIDEVRSLGWNGALTVLALMFVVRPLNVLVSTAGSDLKSREKAFLAWLAPRGIVAAAVASLFAVELEANGLEGGPELRALVFLVIAATVIIQGLFGGIVAQSLGVRRPSHSGYAILSVNPLSLAFARLFRDAGHEVVFLDSNPSACAAGQAEGFRVLFGNALTESMMTRAELDARAGTLALTPNDEANFIFSRRARREFKVPCAWLALERGQARVTSKMVEHIGARILFAEGRNTPQWAGRLSRGQATLETWTRDTAGELAPDVRARDLFLPLVIRRGSAILPVDQGVEARKGDRLELALSERARDAAEAYPERGRLVAGRGDRRGRDRPVRLALLAQLRH